MARPVRRGGGRTSCSIFKTDRETGRRRQRIGGRDAALPTATCAPPTIGASSSASASRRPDRTRDGSEPGTRPGPGPGPVKIKCVRAPLALPSRPAATRPPQQH